MNKRELIDLERMRDALAQSKAALQQASTKLDRIPRLEQQVRELGQEPVE